MPTKAYGLAQEIAENGPLAVSATKAIFNKVLKYQEISAEDMAEIHALRDSVSASEDFKEGMLAFMQKRKADFKGK